MSDPIQKPSNIVPFRASNSAVSKLADAVEVRNADEGSAEIWLTGEVGWDIYAESVIARLKEVDGEGKSVAIFLNSPGGDVFEGYAIGNFLASMKAETTVHVIALAASIASYIAIRAGKVVMPANSMMMIHNASAWVSGEAADLENTAVLLRKLNAQLAAAYATKRERTLPDAEAGEDFAALMDATTWLTAEEAVALGLADEVAEVVKAAACVRADVAARIAVPAALVATEEAEVEVPAEAEAETPADAEVAPVQEEADPAPAELDEEAKAAITAACAKAGLPDRAAGFISARASLDQVRAELFDVMAAADAATETNTRIAPAAPGAVAAQPSIESVRQSALAAVRGKRV